MIAQISLRKFRTHVLDTLFPIHCLSCGTEGDWICSRCFNEIPPLPAQVCPRCERFITQGGILCASCKGKAPLDALISATRYKEHGIEKIIHAYKYKYVKELAPFLGSLMVKAYTSHKLPLPDMIIAVPLHARRLRWRGFNQSELLGQYLKSHLAIGFPILFQPNTLLRTRYTYPQMKIRNYRQRKENIANAFAVKSEINLTGKKILLVDDIATTGATLFECAKVLKKHGAKKVYAIVAARQEVKNSKS